ncbi:MAG TPA: SRPBCC domain-containing protein [Patescibacteria group bacterium]
MENKKIIIEKIFNAPKNKVWEAWTDPELVKKWWGPEGFYAPSIKVDFKVGGKYIYAMHGPKGTQFDNDMYSAGVYKEIVPMEKLVVTDYFSDSEGNKLSPTEQGLPEGMPSEMTVTVLFEEIEENKTKLSIVYIPSSEKEHDAMIASRMEEGWSTSLNKMAKVVEE